MKGVRKILLVVLFAAVVAGLCMFAVACGEEPTPELTGITVSGQYKTEYVEGQTFDDEGMIVTAQYSDGTSKAVSDYTVDTETALKVSDEKVTVSYKEGEITKTAEVKITVVAKAVTGITLKTDGVKKEYFVGDTFSSDGVKVTATYNDGTSGEVTGFTVSKPDMSSAGSKEVTVSYGGATAKYNVTVTAVVLESIEVTKQPTKTEYIEGQTFDKTGMEVTAHYNDERKDKVITDYTVDKTALSTSDTKVTVSYQGKTAEVKITVKAKSVSGITLNTDGVKKDFYVGDEFNSNGLKVTASYDNGTSGEVTGFTVSSPDMSSAGNKTVTVTYDGKTATYEINVKAVEITSIEVTKQPTKTEYIEGQTFDKTGMEVTAHYNNGTSSVVDDYTVDKTTLATSDTKVTVSYNGKTAEVAITVKAKSVSGITLNTDEVKKDYFAGDEFNSDGLTVNVSYDNGTSETVSDGFEIQAPDMMQAGKKTVTVTYEGKTATYEINVQAVAITKLEITTEPKTTYIAGETFDPSGMIVKATYNTGSVDEDFKDYDYDKKNALTVEDKVVTISAGEVSVELNITVLKAELSDIEIKTEGIVKKEYVAGESFDYSGIVVIAHYSDESSEEVSGYTVSVDPATLTKDTTSVTLTVSYGGKEKQVTVDGITVTESVLESIEVTANPSKVDYREGETFESAGLEVTAHYNNEDKVLTAEDYTLSIENGGAFTSTGEVTITVTYDGKETTFTVNVHAYIGIVVSGEYKTEYNCGETFDANGMVVTAQYEGGETYDKVLEAGEYTVSEGELSVDNNTVTVTYNGKVDTITLTVNHKYTESITKEPTYTEAGEKTYTCDCGHSYTEEIPMLTLSAVINDEYETTYANSSEFLIDTAGTVVSGGGTPNPGDNPPAGGIGYLDKTGRFVEYYFITEEAGTFDFVWYVAGNKWLEGSVNAGIDDLSKYMTWTVDGINVNISGIELPAGDTAQGGSYWWNLKKLVVSGVKLDAGCHVVKMLNVCTNETGAAFPNVGSFTVYSDSAITHLKKAVRYDYDGFTSEKENSIILNSNNVASGEVAISEGVKTDADSRAGCFGGFDGAGRWIEYKFTLGEAGSIDIDLAAAGSKWNNGTQSNDGLTNVGASVKLTVDGVPYDLNGIELPAGSGDNAWWNLYEIVIDNIELEAGSHTIRMDVYASGGLNIEDMTIYSTSAITAGIQE